MPQQKLDYRRPDREETTLAWYETELATAAVSAAIILAANAWLVWNADKSWGSWLWVLFYIPAANAVLAAALLASSPIVRIVSGVSASLHVWVTLVGCGVAIFLDAAVIIAQAHGC